MPNKSYHGRKKPVYWWTQEIAEFRKASFAARRKFQRARKRRGPDECRELEQVARETFKTLRVAIRKSQEDSWRNLCQLVDNDPWGLSYKIVARKLIGKRPIPGLSLPGRLQDIVHGLFPARLFVEWQMPSETDTIEPVTAEELVELANALPSGKAPGPDGIPDMVVKAVVLKRTVEVASIFNKCMRIGCFPSAWKEARLVLVRKPEKPLELPSSYRPLSMVNTIGKMFERILKRRLEAHLGLEGLSENQYGFRRGKSTMDAIEKMLVIVNRINSVPWRRRGLCAMVSIDVANAFNTAPWEKIGEALRKKDVPFYLIKILRDLP